MKTPQSKHQMQRQFYSTFLVLLQQAISKKLTSNISSFVSLQPSNGAPKPPCMYLDFETFVNRYTAAQLLDAFYLVCSNDCDLNSQNFRDSIKNCKILMDIIEMRCHEEDPAFIAMSFLL